MARGDLVVFEEAMAFMLDGGWGVSDDIKLALITNATAPTAADETPCLGDYTECTPGGNYAAGGQSLCTWANFITEAGGTVTADDTDATASWTKDASNPQDAYYGLLYNDTSGTDQAFAYIDLGGPIDMQAGDLTITWNASGIFTITKAA